MCYNMAGKPGCGGKKGRSGRKSKKDEMEIVDLYRLATRTVRTFLNNKNATDENKVRIAIEIVKKAMPQKINLGGQSENPIEVKMKFDKMTVDEIGKYILAKLKG